MNSHTESFRVRSYEADPFNQITLTALGGYLQEAAYNHVRALGWGLDELNRRGLTWVLSAMRIEIATTIPERAELVVTTWPAGSERLVVLRDYEVTLPDHRVVARAASQWLLLGLERRRPTRPESVIDPALFTQTRRVFPSPPQKLAAVGGTAQERRFPVRYQDIDMNLHANNTAYLSWVVDAVPEAVWRGCRLSSIEVQYLAECSYDCTVLSRVEAVDEGVFAHAVVREEDGRELARARTRWVERPTRPPERED